MEGGGREWRGREGVEGGGREGGREGREEGETSYFCHILSRHQSAVT